MCIGLLSGIDDLLHRRLFLLEVDSIGNVIADRRVQEVGLLGDDANLPADPGWCQLVQILSVKVDPLTCSRIVKSLNQLKHC